VVDAQTQFIIDLCLLVSCSLLAGELALRLGQLALVGQLLAGVVLGPTLLAPFLGPVVGFTAVSPQLSAIQFLATFFVLFMAGMEMKPEDIFRMEPSTLILGFCIFLIPFGVTYLTLTLLYPAISSLLAVFIAVTLSITALPVMVVMVGEFGLSGKKLGVYVLNLALINELAAVTVFALLLRIQAANGQITFAAVGGAVFSILLFLAIVFAAYFALRRIHRHPRWPELTTPGVGLRTKQAGFAVLIALALGAALFSQYLGLTFIIGAFYAGILVTPESVGKRLYEEVHELLRMFMWGFFIPLFFVIAGLQSNLRLLGTEAILVTFGVLLLVAALSKVSVGAGISRLLGRSGPDALAVGFMVNCRGAVEIAMAVILYNEGFLDTQWFTIVVGVGLITTFLAPLGAMMAWRSTPASRAELARRIATVPAPSTLP
jgi:Kef-type K+ transport system membrane component KefB